MKSRRRGDWPEPFLDPQRWQTSNPSLPSGGHGYADSPAPGLLDLQNLFHYSYVAAHFRFVSFETLYSLSIGTLTLSSNF